MAFGGRLGWYVVIVVTALAVNVAADEERPKRKRLDIESIYYAQAGLVKSALAGVQPSRKGVPEIYFVGFAPDDAEDVFENEVKHVEALFRRSLGADGRTVLLVNSRNTVDELPLANGPNLTTVLEGLADRMGAEDLLFLHITTHGSRAHWLSVSFERLGLNDLSARKVGEIVNGAGLPWRVVVVSACFSGGFIKPLKSPRAMVITAANSRRTSFGCENGREYTYFGAAFYRDSLIDADFRAAFKRAVPLVRAWEKEQDHKHSKPQVWVGKEIAKKLPHTWKVPGQSAAVDATVP
ncbi:MAG: hypothetical protein J4F45_12470 [Pseudomonadales bacterium]|nr:hypothetical protein [Pseudomonadales bacterium]